MKSVLRICASVVLAVTLATYAIAAVTAGMGSRNVLQSSKRMDTGYPYWTCVQNIVGVEPSPTPINLNRYIMHHSLTLSGNLIPVRRVDLMHTASAAVDTITIRLYNGGIADSIYVVAPASVIYYSFPIYADSAAFKPWRASLAGDWIVTTFFNR